MAADTSSTPLAPSDSIGLRMARFSIYMLASSGLTRALAILQSILVARILGVTSLGVLALVGVVSGLVSSFYGFAMDPSVVKTLSQSRNEEVAASRITSTFFVASVGLGTPFVIGLILFSPYVAELLGDSSLLILLVIAAATLEINLVGRVFATVQQSYERIGLVSKIGLATGSFAILTNVTFAYVWGLLGVFSASLMVAVFMTGFHAWVFRRSGPIRVSSWWVVDRNILKHVLKLSSPQFLGSIIETLALSLGPFLLVALHGFTELGWFRSGQAMSSLVLLLPGAVVTPFLPIASRAYRESRRDFDRVYLRSCKYVLLLVLPLALVLSSFPREILFLVYSEEFVPGAAAMPLFAGTAVAMAYLGISGWIFLISGAIRRFITLYSVWSGIVAVSIIAFVPLFGFWGLAFALFTAYVAEIGVSFFLIRTVYDRHLRVSEWAVSFSLLVVLWGFLVDLLPFVGRLLAMSGLAILAIIGGSAFLNSEEVDFFRGLPRRMIPRFFRSSTKLRILVFAPRFHPAIGGVEKHVRETAAEFARIGHEVTVVTIAHALGLAADETLDGVRVLRLQSGRRIQVILQLASKFRLVLGADVIHCHDFVTFYYWFLPFRILLPWKKAFVTFHGYEGYPLPLGVVWRRRLVALLATGCFCMGRYIERWYGTPCQTVILPGVEARLLERPLSSPKEVRATFLGRLEPDTGIDLFLEAVHILRDRWHIDLPLDICGSGSQEESTRMKASSLGLRVNFHGWVEDPTPYLYRSRFAFVIGPLSAVEALVAGCISLAAAGHPIREDCLRSLLLPENAFFVCRTPDEAASVVASTIMESDTGTKPGLLATSRWRPMTWHDVARRYLQKYTSNRTQEKGMGAIVIEGDVAKPRDLGG